MTEQHMPDTTSTPFSDWWTEYIDDAGPLIDYKARTYGSNSLEQIGRLIPRTRNDECDAPTALEIGCFVYAYGKMERVADAILRGEKPGQDSWHDLMVYAAMALYIRDHKRWP